MTNRRTRRAAALVMSLALAAAACSGSGDADQATSSTSDPAAEAVAYPHDDELRLDQVQVIGTHNSYHLPATPEFREAVEGLIPGLVDAFDYTHRPLTEQLDELGVRQFELDIFVDPEGTLYSDRKSYVAGGLPADGGHPELSEPGMKVLHVQEIDAEATCFTLVRCLTEIRDWSTDNPGHVPIFVLIEAKADPIPDPFEMGFVEPLPFDATALDDLDAEIRSVFGDDELITPDLVRGDHDTLAAALSAEGWPALGEVRGRVMFLLDNGGEVADLYTDGHPSLEGRVLFTGNAEPGEPDAAFLKKNDPFDDTIVGLVADGFIVRTRSDGDAHLSDTDPSEQRDAALATGAQMVSSDYPEPGLDAFPDYQVQMPDGTLVRCNPISAPDWCTTSDVENPDHLTD
jgi:hypothetical protein